MKRGNTQATMIKIIKSVICVALSYFLIFGQAVVLAQSTAAILPQGKTQFFDNNGNPLTSGTVGFYIPSTLTPKTTWQDSTKSVANTNPVTLDAAGRAIIYGDGTYRQIVKDRHNNTIWDAVTASVGTGGGTTGTGDGDLVGTVKPWAGLVAPNQYAFAYGQEVSRTTYSALFTAITIQQTVNCTAGSPTLTGFIDTTQIPYGAIIESICLPAGSAVIAPRTPTSVTFNHNATVSTTDTVRIFIYGNGNGSTTFNLPDLRGLVIAGRENMGGLNAARIGGFFGTNIAVATGAVGGFNSITLSGAALPPYTPSGTISAPSITNSFSSSGTNSYTPSVNAPTITNTFSSSGTNSYTPAGTISDTRTWATANRVVIFNGTGPLAITAGGAAWNDGAVQGVNVTGGAITFGGTAVSLTSSSTAPTGNAVSLTSTSSVPLFTGNPQGGTSSPFTNIPPTITLNYIIKITPDSNSADASGVTSLGGMTGDIACGNGLLCTGNTISYTGALAASRERLSTDRTYWVRPLGSNTNCDGLTNANDPGSGAIPRPCAFSTPQFPVTVALNDLDFNGHNVTTNLEGTFTTGIICSGNIVGNGTLTITTTTSAALNTTDANAIEARYYCALKVGGNITFTTSSGSGVYASAISANSFGRIQVTGGITFGTVTGTHFQSGWLQAPTDNPLNIFGSGNIEVSGNYTISGGGSSHIHVTQAGSVVNLDNGITVTLTGTPAFAAYFVGISNGFVYAFGVTFTGAATGRRYYCHRGCTIVATTGSTRNFFPGDVAGQVIAGGWYVNAGDDLSDIGTNTWIGPQTASPGTPTALGVPSNWAWFDSTDLRFHEINSAGTIGTTVVANNCSATGFFNIVSTAGVLTCTNSTPNLGITGTAGNGWITFGSQNAPPSTPAANNFRLYSDIFGRPTYIAADGFLRSIASTLTTNRVYTLQDANGTFAYTVNPTDITATTFTTSGTAGAGYLNLNPQSSNPSAPAANNVKVYATTLGKLAWIKDDGFARVFDSTLTANRTYTWPDNSGQIALTAAANIPAVVQGDILYASSSSALTALAKDTNATRYLSNTGGTNNPAWAQVNLTNGVTGVLPIANGGNGVSTGAMLPVSTAVNVNFNVAGDNNIVLPLPAGYTRLGTLQFVISGASANISAATFGIFSATGGGGTAIVPAGTAVTVTTGADNTANNYQVINSALLANGSYLPIANTIYFRVGTTTAGTANVQALYRPLP